MSQKVNTNPVEVQIPVVRIVPGGSPEFLEATYTLDPDMGVYAPAYRSLKALLPGVDMLERVPVFRTGNGMTLTIWCDEEGRLPAEPKASCIISNEQYEGDICGPCVFCVDTLHTEGIDDPGVPKLVKTLLFIMGLRMVRPVPKGYIPAEPSITVEPWPGVN
jgi:hypothetical protein